MLNIRLFGDKQVVDRLDYIIAKEKSRFGQALKRVALEVEATAKKEGFRQGPAKQKGQTARERRAALRPVVGKLTSRSGRLRSSITHRVNVMEQRAWIGTNVVYGPIHEFGGTIKRRARTQLASLRGRKKGKKLSMWSVKSFEVSAGDTQIPARPYLRPALQSNREKIRQLFALELDKLLDGH